MNRADEIALERLQKQADDELDDLLKRGLPVVELRSQFRKGYLAIRLLDRLTPGGSEFAFDPWSCYSYIKERLESLVAVNKGLVLQLKRKSGE